MLAAECTGNPGHVLTVLVGGEAGVRAGGIRGLRWSDVELRPGPGRDVVWTRIGTAPGRLRPREWLATVQHNAGLLPYVARRRP